MTRINTNVSSLGAVNSLGRSSHRLGAALTRLARGVKINAGKNDPAGLIAGPSRASQTTEAVDVAHTRAALSIGRSQPRDVFRLLSG